MGSDILEANCRKLRTLCEAELRYVAQEGRFDLAATPYGSKLFAIVSTLAELLKADTQLVESINSIVRLIGTRCPSIDLETMSARITTKKAVTGNLPRGSESKRWSNVFLYAKPLLLEMTSAGDSYKQILHDVGRWSQPTRTSMSVLDAALKNTDLTKALPDLKPTPERKWASSHAALIKKAVDAAKRESAKLKAFAALRPASMTVICIRQSQEQALQFFLQATSYRSILFVVKLQAKADGSLEVPRDLQITTTMHLLNGLRGPCHDPTAPKTYEVFTMSAVHVSGSQIKCIQDDAGQGLRLCAANTLLAGSPAFFIQKGSDVKPAQLALEDMADADGDDALDASLDAELLGSGYYRSPSWQGFVGCIRASQVIVRNSRSKR